MEYSSVFSAVSNPVRRRILDILRGGDRSAGNLAVEFPVLPQPAVSRHLRVLRKAGLVSVRQVSQQRIYSLSPDNLKEIDVWVSHYRQFWTGRLDSLAKHLERKTDASKKYKGGNDHGNKGK